MSIRPAGWWCAGMLVVAALALLAAAPPQSDPQQKRVAELIAKLGDEDFDSREDAQKELKRIGKPGVKQLARAFSTAKDLEIRKRAGKLLGEIDPGFLLREQRKGRRQELAKAIAVEKGTDATRWGDPIPNPFTALTEEGKNKLRGEGVEVDKLLKMRAVLIVGNYCGARGKTFVNRDPNTILVFGGGFITHRDVHSVGPILAVEDAHFMSNVRGADLVWFVDKSFPRGQTSGAPLVLGPTVLTNQMRAVDKDVLKGDFGWKAPADLCQPFRVAAELAEARKQLAAQIKTVKGVDVKDHAKPVANPFTNLTDEGKKKLKARGIDVERLAKLKKALYLTDPSNEGLVNRDPDTVLVLGKGFFSRGAVYSLGPVLAVENARFPIRSRLTGADVVWFADKSCLDGPVTGAPLIVDRGINRLLLDAGNKHVWYGDYGWRRPDGWPRLKDKD
jgi:hypothetical protein